MASPIIVLPLCGRLNMARLIVLNHGTLDDNENNSGKGKLITELNKYFKNKSVPFLTYPGFGSPEFLRLYKQNQGSLALIAEGLGAAAIAKNSINSVAKWLKNDVETKLNFPRIKLVDIDKIYFVGWSRGCILTWYQIYHLRKKFNWSGQAYVLNYDPSYGPAWSKSRVSYAQGEAKICWEVLMMHDNNSLFMSYPNNHKRGVWRVFLPGVHRDPVAKTGNTYEEIWKIGETIANAFFRQQGAGVNTNLTTITPKKMRSIYANCKLKYPPRKIKNYSDCCRSYVKQLYDSYKNGAPWSKCGFFYSEEDYLSLKEEYPLVANQLCTFNRNTFKNHRFVRQLDELAQKEEKVFFSMCYYFGEFNKKSKKTWNDYLGK